MPTPAPTPEDLKLRDTPLARTVCEMVRDAGPISEEYGNELFLRALGMDSDEALTVAIRFIVLSSKPGTFTPESYGLAIEAARYVRTGMLLSALAEKGITP